MPDQGQRLLGFLQDFFLWIAWLCSRKGRQLDHEERIGLPTGIIYGERASSRLPSWMSKPPKNVKSTDQGQPTRHPEEWVQQKEKFLHSPNLKRKVARDDKPRKKSRPLPSVPQAILEPPISPPRRRLEDPCTPPIIRVEDWSYHPLPGGSSVEMQYPLVTEPGRTTSIFRPTLASNYSHHGFLAVPTADSPDVTRVSLVPSRQIITGNDLAPPERIFQPSNGVSPNDDQASPGPPRPKRPSRLVLSPSDIHILSVATFQQSDEVEVIRRIVNFKKSVHRQNASENIKKIRRSLGALTTQPMLEGINILTKRYYSNPLPAAMVTSLRGKTHAVGLSDIPTLVGNTISSGARASLTRFHEEQGLTDTPERKSLSQRSFLLGPTAKWLTSGFDDVPYPFVFDLDFYMTAEAAIPVVFVSGPDSDLDSSSSGVETQDSFGTPTPAPKRSSVGSLLMKPICTSSFTVALNFPVDPMTFRTTSDSRGRQDEAEVMVVPAASISLSSSDMEEEIVNSHSEYSDSFECETGSSGELCEHSWNHLERTPVNGNNYTTPDVKPSTIPDLSERSPTLVDIEQDGPNSAFSSESSGVEDTLHSPNDHHFEMDQILASLKRSSHASGRCGRETNTEDSVEERHDEDTLASWVEYSSSGSTLSDYSRHRRPAYPPPVVVNEGQLGGSTKDELVVPEFSSLKISGLDVSNIGHIISDKSQTPPRPHNRNTNMGDLGLIGLRLNTAPQNEQKSVRDKDRYRGTAFTNNLILGAGAVGPVQRRVVSFGAVVGVKVSSVGVPGPRSSGVGSQCIVGAPSVRGNGTPGKF